MWVFEITKDRKVSSHSCSTWFWYWFLKLKSFVFNLHLIELHLMHLVTFQQTIIMKPGTIFNIPNINFEPK